MTFRRDQDGIEDLDLSHYVDDIEIFLGRGLTAADLDADGRIDFVVRTDRVLHFLIRE